MKLKFAFIFTLLFTPYSVMAVEWKPIGKLTAMGGQYFTRTTHSNGANVDASFAPVIALKSNLLLIPIYIGSYHETQSVYNFLGENTLVERQLSQSIVLRSVLNADGTYRFKPRIGYKQEWTQQTSDQGLFKGLFNYQRYFLGFGVERVLPVGSLEWSAEHSWVRYPNYTNGFSDPRLTSTGLSSVVGTNILDFNAMETGLQYQITPESKRWYLSSQFTLMRNYYVGQKVLKTDLSNEAEDNNRTDLIYLLNLQQLFKPIDRLTLGASQVFQYYSSNQNAVQTDPTDILQTPTSKYYNFFDFQLAPSVSYQWLENGRLETTLNSSWGYRKYSARKTQNAEGTIQADKIWSMNWGGGLTFKYRFTQNLSAILTGSISRYTSNTSYEEIYPYNYTVSNYLGGLSFEF